MTQQLNTSTLIESPVEPPDNNLNGRGPATQGYQGKFHLLTPDEILDRPIAKQFVQGLLLEVGISTWYADAGVGKTSVMFDLGLSVATKKPFLGMRVVNPGKVIYFMLEGQAKLTERELGWMKHNNVADMPKDFCPCLDPVDIMKDQDDIIDRINWFHGDVKLVIFDTWAASNVGRERNDNTQVSEMMAAVEEIARTCQCHIALTHHCNRSGTWSGAAAFKDKSDTMIELVRENKDDPIMFRCEKQRDLFSFDQFYADLVTVDTGLVDPNTQERITAAVTQRATGPKQLAQQVHRTHEEQMLGLLGSSEMNNSQWERSSKTQLGLNRGNYNKYRDILVSSGKVNKRVQGQPRTYWYSKIDPLADSEDMPDNETFYQPHVDNSEGVSTDAAIKEPDKQIVESNLASKTFSYAPGELDRLLNEEDE